MIFNFITYIVSIFSVFVALSITVGAYAFIAYLAKMGWWPTLLIMSNYRPVLAPIIMVLSATTIFAIITFFPIIMDIEPNAFSSLSLLLIVLFLPFLAIPTINAIAWKRDSSEVRLAAQELRNRRRERQDSKPLTEDDLKGTLRRSRAWPEFIFDVYRITRRLEYEPPGSIEPATLVENIQEAIDNSQPATALQPATTKPKSPRTKRKRPATKSAAATSEN